jgi:hypothetical protein
MAISVTDGHAEPFHIVLAFRKRFPRFPFQCFLVIAAVTRKLLFMAVQAGHEPAAPGLYFSAEFSYILAA